MKRRLTLVLALLGLLVIANVPAFAQAPDDGDFDDEGMIADDIGPGMDDFGPDQGMMFAGPVGPGMGPGMGMGMAMGARNPDGKRGRGGLGGPGFGLGRRAADLELTKDQQSKLETMGVDFQKEIIPMRAQLQVMKIELQQLIRSDAKQMEIDAKIDQIGRLRADLQKKQVGHRMAMRAVLTPEQREKLNNPPACPLGNQPAKDGTGQKTKNRGGSGK